MSSLVESVLAGLTLTVCVALLMHMAIGPARREKLRLRWLAFRRAGGRTAWRRLWPSRGQRAAARREADEAIERARHAAESAERGQWEGNVYRPKSFDRRPGHPSEKKRPPPH